MFLLALLHAVLEVTVGWGTASVIRDVSDWITAAVTSLKYHASQVKQGFCFKWGDELNVYPLCMSYPNEFDLQDVAR